MQSEKDTEAFLRDEVKARGGRSYKWVSPGCAGVPDRIVIKPGGGVGTSLLVQSSKRNRRAEQALRSRGNGRRSFGRWAATSTPTLTPKRK